MPGILPNSGFSRIPSGPPQNWITSTFSMPDISWKFQQDPSITFWVIVPGFLPNSGFSRIPSGFFQDSFRTTPKLNHFYFLPCPTFPEQFQQDPSIAFWVILPGFLPDHPQNSITCSFWHSRYSPKISARSVHNFLSYLANPMGILDLIRIQSDPGSRNSSGFKVIQDQGILPDNAQNLITCSFSNSRYFLKISERSIHNFLSYLANTKTDRQTPSKT